MTTMTLNFAEEFEKKMKELNARTDNNQRIMDGLTGRLNSIENALLSMQSTVNNTAAQITFLMSKLGGETGSLSTLYSQQQAASDESQKRQRRDKLTNGHNQDNDTETHEMQEENESE
jgi:small-conductance mechanosensitive channel